MNHSHHQHAPDQFFPYGRFFVTTALQAAAAFAVFRFVAPDVFFREMAQPWLIVLWTFLFGLPISLFEYLYHRYMLHSAVFPFLGIMHRCHVEHHGLTNVKAPITQKDPEKLVPVQNEYPIERKEQEESMMFPVFAISIFIAIFTLLIGLPVKLLLPNQPAISAIILTSTLAYSAYELWHAVLHLPYERFWKPWMDNPKTRGVVRHVYSFHLMHHWRPTSNLAVVGFWGFAIWDHLFRTHRRPPHMPVKGAMVNYKDAAIRKPVWPISMLDRWQTKLVPWSRRVERACARFFLRKNPQS